MVHISFLEWDCSTLHNLVCVYVCGMEFLNVNPLCPQNSLTSGLLTVHAGSVKATNMHLCLCASAEEAESM